jgi:hypothetical protein
MKMRKLTDWERGYIEGMFIAILAFICGLMI